MPWPKPLSRLRMRNWSDPTARISDCAAVRGFVFFVGWLERRFVNYGPIGNVCVIDEGSGDMGDFGEILTSLN